MSDTLSQVQNDLEMDTGPTGLGYELYDIVIVYAKEDQDDVEGRFIPWLRNIQRNSNLNDARIHLYDDGDMPPDDYDCVEHLAQRAMYILLYLSENFSTEKCLPFITQETFMKTRLSPGNQHNLTDKERGIGQTERTFKDLIRIITDQNKYAVRPVHTKKMSERTYKIPTGLTSTRGIEFHSNLDSSHTQKPMAYLMKEAVNKRKQRENLMRPYNPHSMREIPARSQTQSQHQTQSAESFNNHSQSEIMPSFTGSNLQPNNSSVQPLQPLDNDTDGGESLSVDSGNGSSVSSEFNGLSSSQDVGKGATGGFDSDLSMDGQASIASGGDTNIQTAQTLTTETNLNVKGGQITVASFKETSHEIPERRDEVTAEELLKEGTMGSDVLVHNKEGTMGSSVFLNNKELAFLRPGEYIPPSLPVLPTYNMPSAVQGADNSGQAGKTIIHHHYYHDSHKDPPVPSNVTTHASNKQIINIEGCGAVQIGNKGMINVVNDEKPEKKTKSLPLKNKAGNVSLDDTTQTDGTVTDQDDIEQDNYPSGVSEESVNEQDTEQKQIDDNESDNEHVNGDDEDENGDDEVDENVSGSEQASDRHIPDEELFDVSAPESANFDNVEDDVTPTTSQAAYSSPTHMSIDVLEGHGDDIAPTRIPTTFSSSYAPLTNDVLDSRGNDLHLSSAASLTSSSLFSTPRGACQVTRSEQQVQQNNSNIFPVPEESSGFPKGNRELNDTSSVDEVVSDTPTENGDIRNLPNLLEVTPDLSNNYKENGENQETKPGVKYKEAQPCSGIYRLSPILMRVVLEEFFGFK